MALLSMGRTMLALLCSSLLATSSSSAVSSDSTVAEDNAAPLPLETLSVDEVQLLLQDWDLAPFFGETFARDAVDGEMVASLTEHDVTAEIQALRPESVARSYHWRRLWKLVQETLAREEQVRAEQQSQPSVERRNLGAVRSAAGLKIKHEHGFVSLGPEGDVQLERLDEDHLLVNSSVTITGTTTFASGALTVVDVEGGGGSINLLDRVQGNRRRVRTLETDLQWVNDTLHALDTSSGSGGHGSSTAGWTHIMSAGCSSVVTDGEYGSAGEECFKMSDEDVNSIMCNGELKIEFYETGDTLFVQLVDSNGDPRDFHYDPSFNGAKWRWVETLPWKGPCIHEQQLEHGYFFFFKTSERYGDCESSNYENSVRSDSSYSGFTNRDSSDFFPMTGWNPHIQMFARTVCDDV